MNSSAIRYLFLAFLLCAHLCQAGTRKDVIAGQEEKAEVVNDKVEGVIFLDIDRREMVHANNKEFEMKLGDSTFKLKLELDKTKKTYEIVGVDKKDTETLRMSPSSRWTFTINQRETLFYQDKNKGASYRFFPNDYSNFNNINGTLRADIKLSDTAPKGMKISTFTDGVSEKLKTLPTTTRPTTSRPTRITAKQTTPTSSTAVPTSSVAPDLPDTGDEPILEVTSSSSGFYLTLVAAIYVMSTIIGY